MFNGWAGTACRAPAERGGSHGRHLRLRHRGTPPLRHASGGPARVPDRDRRHRHDRQRRCVETDLDGPPSLPRLPGRVRRATDGRVWELCSGDDVSFHLYDRGETSSLIPAPAHAKARTEITFDSPSAFVLAARGVTVRTATDMDTLIDKIHLAYHTRRQRPEEGRWYRDYAFVFEVADAERFTALLPSNGPHAWRSRRRAPRGRRARRTSSPRSCGSGPAPRTSSARTSATRAAASTARTSCAPRCSRAGARSRAPPRAA